MRKLAVVSSLLAMSAAATAAPPPLESKAKEWADTLGHGTVVVAHKRDGKWHYGVGNAPAGTRAEDLVFEIGSISKVFTGLLLAHAVHEDKLALDDTLAQRLPVEFADAATGAITLEQLAAHTSCLPRLPTNMTTATAADPYATYDDKAMFDFLAKHRLDARAPCASDYSNVGYGVLGVVLERAYGKSWEALVQEKIAKPLGMTDTAQLLSKDQQRRFAEPWAGTEHASPWTFAAIAGAGALRSTAKDMSRFADALLATGTGPLAPVWDTYATPRAEMPGTGAKLGLGLMASKFHGLDSYGHDGGTGGFRSLLLVHPKEQEAILVLAANADAAPMQWVSAWRKGDAAETPRVTVDVAANQLGDYAGVYTLAPKSLFTVLVHDGALLVRLTGQPFLPVHASAKDEFFYKAVDAQLSFRRDAAGRITAVTLHQNGRDVDAPRTADAAPKILFPDAKALGALAGDYDFGKFMPGAKISITAKGTQLFAQLTGQPALPVFNVAPDRYEYDVVEAALQFERNVDDSIAAVVLHQNGAEMRAPRIAKP